MSTNSSPKGSWWRVDLGTEYYINLIIVYNRVDRCCMKGIDKAQVSDNCSVTVIIKRLTAQTQTARASVQLFNNLLYQFLPGAMK